MIAIAEIGINHNGDIELAKKMVDAAKWAGADMAKFQTSWDITRLYEYSFTKSEWLDLKEYCDDVDITFSSTPHTFDAIHFLDDLVPIYKIASTYLGLPNFLVEVAKKNKPILLSTGNIVHDNGMATLEEIRNALSYIPDADVSLLHCISKYPCNDSHLERIEEIKTLGYPVGLSDHTKNYKFPKYPVIEKHFMLKGIGCIDENVSIDQYQFKEMVNHIHTR